MLNFPGPHARTYVMCADTQEEMEGWMKVGMVWWKVFKVLKTNVDYLFSVL